MTYDVGDTVRLTLTVNPDEAPTLTVRAPDGTTRTPAVTGSAGSYAALVKPDTAGTWRYTWTTTNGVEHGWLTVTAPVPPLLTVDDLGEFMRRQLKPTSAERAIRVAAGWLRDATKLTAWPDPVPDDLWAWALELAAIAYDNPTGRATQTDRDNAVGWMLGRRAEILAAASRRYATSASQPLYSFPPAVAYPQVLP